MRSTTLLRIVSQPPARLTKNSLALLRSCRRDPRSIFGVIHETDPCVSAGFSSTYDRRRTALARVAVEGCATSSGDAERWRLPRAQGAESSRRDRSQLAHRAGALGRVC